MQQYHFKNRRKIKKDGCKKRKGAQKLKRDAKTIKKNTTLLHI